MLKIIGAFLLLAPPILAAPMGHEAALQALMPDSGRLLNGVFPGGYTGKEDDITPEQVRDYERLVGKRVAWVMFSHNWFQGRAFPAQTAGWIRGQGATPYIRVMLRSDTELSHRAPLYTLQAIVDGDFDSDLAAWGQAAALFKQAYRHIIDVIRAAGASNVVWVFHVNNLDGPPKRWNRFEGYYPEDDYIDWLGVSVYSAQGPAEEWAVDFTESSPEVMARFSAMAPEKPMIVAELGTDVRNPREPAGPWADAALRLMLSGRYPNLIGFNWWNETWPNGDDPADATDYRVGSSPEITAVMRRHLANRRVQGRP